MFASPVFKNLPGSPSSGSLSAKPPGQVCYNTPLLIIVQCSPVLVQYCTVMFRLVFRLMPLSRAGAGGGAVGRDSWGDLQ